MKKLEKPTQSVEETELETDSLSTIACTHMELAMLQLAGERGKWQNSHSLFRFPKFTREALMFVAKLIERETNSRISTDEVLRANLLREVRSLEADIPKLNVTNFSQVLVLSHFVHIIANLFGFDHFRGEINRQIIYYQTQEQQERDVDYETRKGSGNRAFEYIKRYEAIRFLFEQGINRKQISLILGLPYHKICTMLREEEIYARSKRAHEFLEQERARIREQGS